MGRIEVTSSLLRQKAEQLLELAQRFESQAEHLRTVATNLSTMWEGEANNVFMKTFLSDYEKFMQFAKLIRKYVYVLLLIAKKYEEAEMRAAQIAIAKGMSGAISAASTAIGEAISNNNGTPRGGSDEDALSGLRKNPLPKPDFGKFTDTDGTPFGYPRLAERVIGAGKEVLGDPIGANDGTLNGKTIEDFFNKITDEDGDYFLGKRDRDFVNPVLDTPFGKILY